MLNKIIPSLTILSCLILSGCRQDRLVQAPELVKMDEEHFALNTFFNDFQLITDSFSVIKNGQDDLYLLNIHTGKVKAKFMAPDSILPRLIKEMAFLFPSKNIFKNQDSLNKSRDPQFPLKTISNFSVSEDTIRCIAYYTLTGRYQINIDGKKHFGFINDSYPVLFTCDKNLRLIKWQPVFTDSTSAKQMDIALAFTYSNSNFYFADVMTFLMKGPGGMQLRVYTLTDGDFVVNNASDKSLPLSPLLVKKMGYSDTTVRNAGGPQPNGTDDFDYTIRTLNGQVFFSNKFQLVNVTAGKEIFDGFTNDFTIHGYTEFPNKYFCILSQKNDPNTFSLILLDSNYRKISEENISLEKEETVINADLNPDYAAFIVQKKDKLYFKYFRISEKSKTAEPEN